MALQNKNKNQNNKKRKNRKLSAAALLPTINLMITYFYSGFIQTNDPSASMVALKLTAIKVFRTMSVSKNENAYHMIGPCEERSLAFCNMTKCHLSEQ